ncbi:PLP-dependent aminotransferase family protein [Phytoactinopolyspora mesophila]|uniref:Aminotransferase class I/II-fold pyridoxal phosphate-dependent enzyme n=1 Tax=Phytoactinopolyspora mesophila TaxID=2650750 RepID=A0A7K3LX13_9ACTN|nr:PLP-dependent aminotransferase family protein [Phytoactinopolyspora mesophila]NDL55500.1 aminotransferase class I/II-fold pyridoxal phosphate-dependent enzyme [Phytoactinopolyspora mesophila]
MKELPITLDRGASLPLASQVADGIRSICARGFIRVGDRLPSTRALASSLGVSRTVTESAFEQLHAEGWITGRRGSGTYVAAVPPDVAATRDGIRARHTPGDLRAPWPGGPRTAPGAMREPGWEVSSELDLRPGSPWAAGMRPDVWRRAWRSAADLEPDRRPLREGFQGYRAAVEEHLLRHRGLAVESSAVLATAGTTAAVTELSHAVLGRGSKVAVEEPGYPRAVGAFRAAGVEVLPVPVDSKGVVVNAIPARVAAVYCTPAHQFPLGGRLPATRRSALVEWARRSGSLIIEDDYDGELRYDVAPLPLLAAIGPDVVIHLGTASKVISPTLGAGWMVARREVSAAVAAYREETGTGPSPAGQRVLTAMAELGDLGRHLRRVRRELAARRALVVSTLEVAGARVIGDRAGAHVVLLVENADAELDLVVRAADAGVQLDGLRRCFAGPSNRFGVTLGYSAPARRRDLENAIHRVVGCLVRTE